MLSRFIALGSSIICLIIGWDLVGPKIASDQLWQQEETEKLTNFPYSNGPNIMPKCVPNALQIPTVRTQNASQKQENSVMQIAFKNLYPGMA